MLRNLGKQTIATSIASYAFEWITERRVQILIDKNESQKAKNFLLSTAFQNVHQTYTRTGLWKQITDKLNILFLPIPLQLGEDRLAIFGAYREYE